MIKFVKAEEKRVKPFCKTAYYRIKSVQWMTDWSNGQGAVRKLNLRNAQSQATRAGSNFGGCVDSTEIVI